MFSFTVLCVTYFIYPIKDAVPVLISTSSITKLINRFSTIGYCTWCFTTWCVTRSLAGIFWRVLDTCVIVIIVFVAQTHTHTKHNGKVSTENTTL